MLTNYVNARGLMADAKFYESYSRFNENTGKYETWEQAVDRTMDMHRTFYKDKMTDQLSNLIDEATEAYKEKLVLGAQRSLQFGGDQILKNNMKLYNCFSRDTRFLTSSGIKSFADFSDGDRITVKTHLGNWKQATVKSYGKQKLNRVTFKRRNSKVSVDVTANHRWILRGGIETTDLSVGDQLVEFQDNSFNDFDWQTASIEEKLYWCYGLVYGDGTVTKTGSGEYSLIRLCGKDIRYVDRFKEMGFKTSTNLSIDGDFFAYTGSYNKTLPDINVDGIDLVRAFVRGLLDADGEKKQGWYDNDGSRKFTSITQSISAKKGEDTREFIKDIFPVVGAWIVSEWDYVKKTNLGEYEGIRFTINDNLTTSGTSGYWTVLSIEDLEVEETVWCLEVEDDKSFLLEYGIPTGNCTSTYIDRPAAFSEIFWVLLCGAGVGFSVQKHHIAKLPDIQERKKSAKTFVVEDSIEGWADSVAVLMSSYFIGGGTHPEYEGRRVYFDLSNIRPRGAYISGGFKAPGPEPLRKALDKIEYLIQGRLLKGFTTLRPIDAYDIVMFIADAVLSGGVRRSATICLFSYEDEEMMTAKTGNWFIDNPQRARSNNSVVLIREETTREMFTDIFEKTKQFGEPGFAFFDSKEFSTNPCITSDTIIDTDQGQLTVSELVGRPFNAIVNGNSYPSIVGFVQTGIKEVFEIITESGHRVKATTNHKILTEGDKWVELGRLKFGDKIVLGDGSLSALVSREYVGIEPVYDARVEEVHRFVANGIIVHNCFEIGMLPVDIETGNSGFQGCNLTEINGSKTTSKEEFFRACRAATIIGTLQAGYTNFGYLTEETKRIFEREALLGVSITGWMNSPDILFDKEILRAGAKIVKDTNKYVAKLLGINPAARTTCTKPSGNASVLLMTASGIHAEHSERYLRTVQMNKDQEVAQLIRNTNRYMVEDSVWSADNTDYSIAFPIVSPPNSLFKEQLLGIELLEKVKFAQQYWVEEGTNVELCVDPRIRHNISNTITVPDDKWDEVEQYVFDNKEYFAGISLLSQSGDKDYFQAPFIAVLTPEQIVENYGAGGIFGAGLIADSLRVFPNLWTAISVAKNPSDQSGEQMDNRSDWIRRFNKFADNYFDGNVLKAEYCLKDLYVCHKWEKIQQNFVPVDFVSELKERKYTDIDTLGSQACVGQACEIVF